MADEITSPFPPDDLSGKTLGQYHIVQKLGAGGMAIVYLAEQPTMDRTVAIKIMPSQFLYAPQFLQRFEREVKVIARLQHPRILPVYDYGQIEERPYIVMAYMPGGTLADRIKEGPMPLDEVIRLTNQIAEGLDHAHSEGVIHRDFKPSNVLLDKSSNAYLADFGIAKISETTVHLTGSSVIGTPSYMAPEMGQGSEATPAVDVYALGITVYQMLAGKLPYEGGTPIRMLMAHATDPIPGVRVERPDLPPAIEAVLKKAMAKNPEDRYRSAGELADALQAAASGEWEEIPLPPETVDIKTPTPTPIHMPTPPPPTPASVPTPPSPMPSPQATPVAAPLPSVGAAKPSGSRAGLVIGIIAGALVLGAILCGGGLLLLGALGSAASPATPPRIQPPPGKTVRPANPTGIPPAAQAGGSRSIVIDNRSGADICYVLISPTDSDAWGDDWLDDTEKIATGTTRTFSGLQPGIYDMLAADCDQEALDQHYGISLERVDYRWEVRAATASLTITNQSSHNLCAVYFSAPDDTVWGESRLDDGVTISSGSSMDFALQPGQWDLRVEACSTDNYVEKYDVDVGTAFEWTITD